jgi:hypothetical protein
VDAIAKMRERAAVWRNAAGLFAGVGYTCKRVFMPLNSLQESAAMSLRFGMDGVGDKLCRVIGWGVA